MAYIYIYIYIYIYMNVNKNKSILTWIGYSLIINPSTSKIINNIENNIPIFFSSEISWTLLHFRSWIINFDSVRMILLCFGQSIVFLELKQNNTIVISMKKTRCSCCSLARFGWHSPWKKKMKNSHHVFHIFTANVIQTMH